MLFHNLTSFGFILIKCFVYGPSTSLSKVTSVHVLDCDVVIPELLDRFVHFVTEDFHEKSVGNSDSQQCVPII